MKIFFTRKKWLEFRNQVSESIGFVPTMGALHHGHLELIIASKQHYEKTVVSIFVNPKQFNQVSDLNQYPKTIEEDLEKLAALQVDAVFLPLEHVIYPENDNFKVALPGVAAQGLEGSFRPGHFEGVVNVVDRLFDLIRPKGVFFGQKDLQQCMVLQELTRAKYPEVAFTIVETVREPNGLAMSSRNVRLTEEARLTASGIFQTLSNLMQGSLDQQMGKKHLESIGIRVEYLEYMDIDLNTRDQHVTRAWLFAGYLNGVRLIDNVIFN